MKEKFLKVISWFRSIFPIVLSFIVKLGVRIGKTNNRTKEIGGAQDDE